MKPVVAVAVLLVLTGCGGTSTSATTAASSDTATPIPTATETPTLDPPNNPFEADPVIVSVDNPTNRSFAPLVQNAIAYWETRDQAYGDYTVTLQLDRDAKDPDLLIAFRDEISVCGIESNEIAVGCAPYPDNIHPIGQNRVRIETGYSNASTLRILKHELGHVFGNQHGELPMPLMAETAALNTTAQPNATVRSIPWQNNTIRVYIDEETFAPEIQDEIDNQVSNTLAWFNDGKGKTPGNLTVERVQNRSKAEIVVTSGSVREDYVSTTNGVYGEDFDGDGALEQYTNMTIIIDPRVEADEFGWNLGYWIDCVVNPDENSEAFADPDGGDRRDWWEHY